MTRRVFRSPGSSDPDKAPWENTHPKLRAARKAAEEAGKLPSQAVLDRLNKARGPRGAETTQIAHPRPLPPPPPPEDTSSSFWAPPATEPEVAAVVPPDEFLSGDEEFFDPATGWDFQAITDHQIEAVSGSTPIAAPQSAPRGASPAASPPLAQSGEFAVEIDDDEPVDDSPAAAGPPLSVDQALERAQALFGVERDGDALKILVEAADLTPADPRLAPWIQFGERRITLRLCPTGGLDRVPQLGHPLESLVRAASPAQTALLSAVDGRRNAATLQQALGVDVSSFWKTVGRLIERGWLTWADEA